MTLREIEAASISQFVQQCADDGLLCGRVLDYGCGLSPYKDVVDAAGASYHGFDRAYHPGSVVVMDVGDSHPLRLRWDVVLLTQVVQYLPRPLERLQVIGRALRADRGVLLATGPTNWPIVETEDLWRFTVNGAARLLEEAGFREIDVRQRAAVTFEGEQWSLGWQAVARA